MHKKAVLAVTLAIAQLATAQMKPKPASPLRTSGMVAQPTHIPVESARRIGRDEAIRLSRQGQAIFVDVRSRQSFDTAHIAGAMSLPQSRLQELTPGLPKNKMLITYCACEEEHTAALSVLYFNSKGIKNTAALTGGWKAWLAAGLPVESTRGH